MNCPRCSAIVTKASVHNIKHREFYAPLHHCYKCGRLLKMEDGKLRVYPYQIGIVGVMDPVE